MIRIKEQHKEKFLALMTKYNKIGAKYSRGMDVEYGAAYYILTAEEDFLRCYKYISDGTKAFRGAPDFQEIFEKEGFSSTQVMLLKLAANLFNDWNESPNLGDIVQRFDGEQYRILISAIQILRGQITMDNIDSIF